MNITHNTTTNEIEIKDDLKNHYFLLKSLMILNLANAVLNLSNIKINHLEIKVITWLLLGFISLAILFSLIIKKTTQAKIPVLEIKNLDRKKYFLKETVFIKLKNGKERDLNFIKTQSEYESIRSLLIKIGVPN